MRCYDNYGQLRLIIRRVGTAIQELDFAQTLDSVIAESLHESSLHLATSSSKNKSQIPNYDDTHCISAVVERGR